ncbi:hypothetical protein [Granulicoccus sp. GXG6511]|uniref:hypothetical protein n=1 Tax=Granulicoccus sp. GXG6511 TaxID=3381351 RepID=UPI003D7E9179
MRSIVDLTWPDTFGQRFKLALVTNLLAVCLVTFVGALVFGPSFIPAVLILIVVSVLMSLLTAAIAEPGRKFWKPLVR